PPLRSFFAVPAGDFPPSVRRGALTMATRREPESESRVPDPGLEVSGPTDADVPAPLLEAPAPVPGVLPVLPPLRPPLRGETRVMSDAELLERRIEHLPAGP